MAMLIIKILCLLRKITNWFETIFLIILGRAETNITGQQLFMSTASPFWRIGITMNFSQENRKGTTFNWVFLFYIRVQSRALVFNRKEMKLSNPVNFLLILWTLFIISAYGKFWKIYQVFCIRFWTCSLYKLYQW
jgi:hypothetical protein